MLIKVLLFFCYCFSSKSSLLSLAPFSLGQAIKINFEKKRKQGRASGEKPKSKRRKKHKDFDSKKKSTKSDNKSIQSNKETTTTCDVCQRNCSTTYNLRVHKRTHTGEKPYPCDVCKKEFARNETLIIHKRTHTGEKPYKCDVCNRKFTIACTLKNHERTHTGEKPFQCHVCLETFTQNGSCKRHLQQQHNINTAVPQEETQAGQESNSTRGDFNQSEAWLDLSYQGALPTFEGSNQMTTSHMKDISEGDFNQLEAWLDPSYQGVPFSVEGSNPMPTSHMKNISEEETQSGQEANSTRMKAPSEWDLNNIKESLVHCYQEKPFSFEDNNNILEREA